MIIEKILDRLSKLAKVSKLQTCEEKVFRIPVTVFCLLLVSCGHLSGPNKETPKNERLKKSLRPSEVYFIGMGDLPYVPRDSEMLGKLKNEISPLNPEFLIHVGDFKSGGSPCHNNVYTETGNQIFSFLPGKTIYTPGDNDWTDCDRGRSGAPYSELERYNYLKKNIISQNSGYPKMWNIQKQNGLEENMTWMVNGITFSSFHLVATNNGRSQVLKDDPKKAIAFAKFREKKNLDWLEKTFKGLKLKNPGPVVLIFHADIFAKEYKEFSGPCKKDNEQSCDGHLSFREAIKDYSQKFSVPIVLIHGDTNDYCLDQPLMNAKNLWRLNLPGDYKVSDVAEVIISENPQSPVRALTLFGREKPANECLQ